MRLFLSLVWFEYKRLKLRLWGLFFVLAMLASGLKIGDAFSSSTNFSFSTTTTTSGTGMGGSTTTSNPLLDLPQDYDKLIKTLPALGLMAAALIAGIFILMTAPFRGSEEWRSGGFQLFFLCDHSFYKLESMRFLVVMLLSVLFYLVVQLMGGYDLMKEGLITGPDFLRANMVLGFWYFSILAVFFSFGCLMSAVSTAYFHKGRSKVLAGLTLLGVIQFARGLIGGAIHVADPNDSQLLLPFTVGFSGEGLLSTEVVLPLEWLGITAALCVLFIVWGARVYEEVEA